MKFSTKKEDTNNSFSIFQKKNEKVVLKNNKGKIISPEFDWISEPIGNIRICEDGIMLYYFNNETGKCEVLPRVIKSDEQNLPEVYASAEENGVTQIFLNGSEKATFLMSYIKEFSKLYNELSPLNKNNLRIGVIKGKAKRGVEIISRDGQELYGVFDSITNADENGIRIATTKNGTEKIYTLLTSNYDKINKSYKEIKRFDNENYHVVLETGEQMVVGSDGKKVQPPKRRRGKARYIDDGKYGMNYDPFSPVNFDDVPRNVTRFKVRGSEVIKHDGRDNIVSQVGPEK